MIIKQATSITDAYSKVKAIIASWDGEDSQAEVLFRGSASTSYKLLPGAYRRKGYEEYQPLLDFCQLGERFGKVGAIDEWETYYLAQHHGIPTRLLDWTESLGAAAFFAFDRYETRKTPCIWILEAGRFNELSIGWDGLVTPENNQEVEIWLPNQIIGATHQCREWEQGNYYDNRYPLAVFPKRVNARIQSQMGCFTIHGRERMALEDYIAKWCANPKSLLARIDFPKMNRTEALTDLRRIGIQRTSIYPDMDNFVRQLAEDHGWND